jgi:predicted nucleic acid-binding protein
VIPARVLLDTSVPLYAIGAASPLKEPATALIEAIAGNDATEVLASTEMIQEFVFHRLRVTGSRAVAVADANRLMAWVTLLDFDRTVLSEALRLIRQTNIGGRDAVHAATALVHHIPVIVSADKAFDAVPGLSRLTPGALA